MPSRQYGVPRDPRRETSSKGGSSQYGKRVQDSSQPKTAKEDPSPPSVTVSRFHRNADTDSRIEAIHHTLGPMPTQASPGNHTHDGGNSPKILEGYTITGSKGTPETVFPSIINCLVRLGATDNTTA